MKWLVLPLLAVALAACSTAPKKSPSPASSGHAGKPSSTASSSTAGRDCSRYAPAQEDLSTRGNYTAGGLYKPGVSDTTPDHVPDLDCIREPVVTAEARSSVGNKSPYSVLGKQYKVLDRVDGYVEQGTASYYGNKFHGRRTSNQEVYDMYAYSAAHKSLPLPSFARVTNLDNGKSVVVRVNDRGPFHEGRVIDLSYAAAVRLGITQRGTGRVEVRGLTADGNVLAAAPAPSSSGMDQLVGQLPRDAARYHVPAKPGDAALAGHAVHMTATPRQSLEAAAEAARAAGVQAHILSDEIEGESREVGKVHGALARAVARHGQPFARPCVILSGGETTVTIRPRAPGAPPGRGGRAGEFCLGLAQALQGQEGVWALAADTDGIDGVEDNAGARVAPDTLARAEAAGLRITAHLDRNDACGFFEPLGDLVITGPTHTNVNDFRALLIL